MKDSGKIFIGIIAAATAGVVIGMLIAPEKGDDLRRNIKNSVGDWSKKLGNLMAEGKEQFDGMKSLFADSSKELATDAKNAVNEALKNGKA